MITPREERFIRLAALLHDIGHLPAGACRRDGFKSLSLPKGSAQSNDSFLVNFLLDIQIGVGMGQFCEITDNTFAQSETFASAPGSRAEKTAGTRWLHEPLPKRRVLPNLAGSQGSAKRRARISLPY